jgi:hypothetical protein
MSSSTPIPTSLAIRAIDSLNEINAASIEAVPVENRYVQLKSNDQLADSRVLRMINGLEIEEFLPAKIAILLKLNWNDLDFSSALLSRIVQHCRGKGQISHELAEHMLNTMRQPTNYSLEKVLHLLYACMRIHKGEDVYSDLDLIRVSDKELLDLIGRKELLCGQMYLRDKLSAIAEQFPDAQQRQELSCLQGYITTHNQKAFKDHFIRFLDRVVDQQPEGVKKFIFEEIKQVAQTLPEAGYFTSLYRILKTHDFYSKSLKDVVELTSQITHLSQSDGGEDEMESLASRCHTAFHNTLTLLADYKNMSKGSMTLYSLQHGLLRDQWKKINCLFEGKRHLFCECHANESADRKALWPLNQSPFVSIKKGQHQDRDNGDTAAVFGCNWGSGHKQATINACEILEDVGAHAVSIDIPDDMLCDHPENVGRPSTFSATNVVNFLAQNKSFAVINFLRTITGMNSVMPLPEREKIRKALQRMLLINPSYVISTIGSQSEPIYKAAEMMGIPSMHIVTDVDRKIMSRAAPLEYPYHKELIPYAEDVMVPHISTTERPEQIAVAGPPTKRVYDIDRSEEDIDRLRQELRMEDDIDIPRGKKLVVVSNGSAGSFSPYPEIIQRKIAELGDDFVVVVLCGNNNESYFNHVNRIASYLPRGTIIPKRLVKPETMEKLYRVSSRGGCVVGKAGGMTIFELSKCGARLIVDNMPSKFSFSKGFFRNFVSAFNWILKRVFKFQDVLPWEKINQDFAMTQGFASSVTNEDEFCNTLKEMLKETSPRALKTEVKKFSQRLPEVVSQLKHDVEEDETLKERRKYQLQPELAATIF